MLKKKIILLSQNEKKLKEYQKIFNKYDILVEIDKTIYYKEYEHLSLEEKQKLKENLSHKFNNQNYDTIAIMWETSNLYNSKTNKISPKNVDMELVYNETKLYFYTKDKIYEEWAEKINGWIDLNKKNINEDTFGWDNIFVVSTTGLTYHELNKRNIKISPRNKLLSKFIKNFIYYKNNLDLNFNKQNQERNIEFDNKVIEFINTNKYLNLPTVKENFEFIFKSALNNGAFFRSSINRRQKNYWLPGLNAGIPLVAKKDEIHEITFAVHDFCHFMMPDLIFDGNIEFNKNLYKNIYIIYRMMSEALTMVMADMLFIDNLIKENINYDFNKRKIYPLYKTIMEENPKTKIKDILYANVQYCLKGNDSFYNKLLNNKNLNVLNDFKEKYEPFFIEDFKWTEANFENMYLNKEIFINWYEDNNYSSDFKLEKISKNQSIMKKTSSLFKEQNLLSVNDFENKIFNHKNIEIYNIDILIDKIFNYVYKNIYFNKNKNYSKNILNISEEKLISNSFKKYMLGQMFLFYKFDFLAITKPYLYKIQQALGKDILTKFEIDNIRDLYENYLNILKNDLHLIDEDDFETYKEVFPIFDSFYVFYDKEKSYYSSLNEISKKILKI